MTGDDRVRFCGGCEKNVYNLSGMRSDEAEALLAEYGTSLCVRFKLRRDGTVVTLDGPARTGCTTEEGAQQKPTLPVVRRAISRAAVTAVSVGVSMAAMACGSTADETIRPPTAVPPPVASETVDVDVHQDSGHQNDDDEVMMLGEPVFEGEPPESVIQGGLSIRDHD